MNCTENPEVGFRRQTPSASASEHTSRPLIQAITVTLIVFSLIPVKAFAEDEERPLEEIVVTANRKEQNIQDVVGSVQALDGAVIDQLGQVDFQSYINTISSVGFTETGNGAVKLGMRGVSNITGTSSGVTDSVSTVAIYLNDIPIQGNGPLPDLALYDLQRIEVLKGPQGTLYGEGAMGGAVKMVLNRADPSAFYANVNGSLSSTESGGGNYQIRSMINVPVAEDKVAFRIVADYRNDSGFIDNVVTGENNVNSQDIFTTRALLNAQINDQFSAELMYFYQDKNMDDFPDYDPDLGDLKSGLLEDRYNKVKFSLFGLTLNYDFGGAELISSTSYWSNDRSYFDRNAFVGYLANFTFEPLGLPTITVPDPQGFTVDADQHSFAQEFRLSSTGDERFDWTLGAFYRSREQDSLGDDTLPGIQEINDAMLADAAFFEFICGDVGMTLEQCLFDSPTDIFTATINEKYEQLAFFGEFDWALTEDLELTVGLRWFDEDIDVTSVQEAKSLIAADFIFLGFPTKTVSQLKIKEDGFAPRFALSYRLSDDMMMYGLISKGFRSGGPNFEAGRVPGIPESYGSDNLWNYELGYRGTWMEGRLITNATAFYLDWNDIQLNATTGFASYRANGGKAGILGAELEIAVAPTDQMQIGFNMGVMDSELKSLGPDTQQYTIGSSLPNAPDLTASGFFDYTWPAGPFDSQTVFHIDGRYVDVQAVQLAEDSIPESAFDLGSYFIGDAQFGFESDDWAVYLFVQNFTNKRALLNRIYEGFLAPGAERVTVVRPRTYGLRFMKSF